MGIRLFVLAAAALAWLSSGAAAEEAFYMCDDKTELTATFRTDPNAVDLVFKGTNVRENLPQVLSADGGRYAAGDTEFWIKGRQATLSRGQNKTVCETKR
ncbi:MAG: MliC family protein [Proteobacteria bacterium]|nr:MliC family protein [Pseudomonadota bacterium]